MKKFLNCLMAFGLVLSAMCVNVNAEHKVTELELEKTVVLDGGDLLPTETFNFEMIPATVPEGTILTNLEVKPGIDLGDKNSVSISYDVAGSELTQKVSFDLSGLVFDKEAAIYRYEVKEIAGTTTAMTYDETSYIVDVYVTNEGNIEYVIAKNEDATEKKVVSFSNTYETETLVVSKDVEGVFSDKNKEFTFRLTLDEISTVPAGTVLTASKAKQDGTFEDVEIIVGAENAFTLKHGENLTINNLPEGMTYAVTEDEAEGYTATFTDSDNGVMSDDGATVDFVNSKIENVETGIMLNMAPYAVSVVLAFGLVAYFVATRKKESEE